MSILKVDAYPCQWPAGWPRTAEHERERSQYRTDFVRARDNIVRQLRLMGAQEVVISSNVSLRRDGLPYAESRRIADPAVAVYWYDVGRVSGQVKYLHRVLACDKWREVRENLHAIGKSIEALRSLQRAGATQVIEKAFSGFRALAADNPARSWREVMDIHASQPVSRELLMERYRELAKRRHPDRETEGGSHVRMTELDAALRAGLSELGLN